MKQVPKMTAWAKTDGWCIRLSCPIWEILVPNKINGKVVSLGFHREWDRKVSAISGGITILDKVKGKWMNDKELVCDSLIKVNIACSYKSILQIARITKIHYGQESVAIIQTNQKMILV